MQNTQCSAITWTNNFFLVYYLGGRIDSVFPFLFFSLFLLLVQYELALSWANEKICKNFYHFLMVQTLDLRCIPILNGKVYVCCAFISIKFSSLTAAAAVVVHNRIEMSSIEYNDTLAK